MTGKEMLIGIGQLDVDLIEEAEFGAFRRGNNRFSKKKTILFLLVATLILGTMTAAAVFTRWSNTMQFGYFIGERPSEEIKKQAEQSGLVAVPTETMSEKKAPVSATDNGITVTVTQTAMDNHGGKAVFRIEGMRLEPGQAPWAWWDYHVDGVDERWGWGAQFFNGIIENEDGTAVYAKNGQPVPFDKDKGYISDYQDHDGSIEFSIDFGFPQDDGRYFGKEMTVTFTGFGVQGEHFEDEDIMTVPGKWELRWTLEGSTATPRKWTPKEKIGQWDVTLEEVEIGQYSMTTVYRIDDKYEDWVDFTEQTGWGLAPWGVRLKDGTDIDVYGQGGGTWDAENHLYTDEQNTLNVILNPDEIAGMYFYAGYELDAQGYRVDREPYYIPFQ